MAYNVKFLKGASAEYSVLENKDMNTFYYVDNKDLYLGTIKLSNGEDLAAAILRVAENETDIANLQKDIAGLTGGEGSNGTISTMISDAIDALRTELKADYEAKIKVNTDAVAQNAKDIDAIEADYLKAADKAELAASIKAIADDYLVEADKTELSGKIAGNTAAINTLNGDDTVEGSVAKEVKDAINAFATAMTDNGTYDTFAELVNYVETHGGEATQMAGAISALETKVGEKSVKAQIEEAIAAENLAQYATDADLEVEKARIKANEDDIAALELLIGSTGEGSSVVELIATAKEEAIAAAAKDASDKDVVVLKDAKEYADGLAGNYATAAQGTLASTALQPSMVKTAAYAEVADFDAAGSSANALTAAKNYTDAALTWGTIA